MADKNYNPGYEPDPAQPPPYQQQGKLVLGGFQDQKPQQGQDPRQGKLVLGGFQDQANQRSSRRPYQYQPTPPQPQAPEPQYPSRPPMNSRPPQQYPQQQPQPQTYIPSPGPGQGNLDATRYPYQQTQHARGGPNALPPSNRRAKRRRGCLIATLVVLVLLVVLGTFAVSTAQRVLAFGSAISPQAPLSTQTGYMGTSDRTNVLIMGFGGGSHDGAYLTDSMLTVSLLPQSRHTSLVSVPRDLWVQYPPNSGNYTKINAIYTQASNNNQNPVAGGNAATQKISLITGMDVKYWMTIDFTGFRALIDSIGGVDVYVPNSFNACYPKNDDANVDASWIKVQFNKGMQHMNGETAIRYARAREPLDVCGQGTSQNLAELTDFGRSARQQIIIKAALSKVRQISTWPKLFDAMNALQHTIYTNMSLADLAEFTLKMDLNDPKAAHIGLSNANVLADSSLSDGTYILAPQNGNWAAIPPYIKQNLYN